MPLRGVSKIGNLLHAGRVSGVNFGGGLIGTRAATAAGRFMASQLGFDLARNEVAVVSGFARGIDAWAHRGAVNAITRIEDHAHSVARPIAVVESRATGGSMITVEEAHQRE